MKNKKILNSLKELHKHLAFYNEMAPFPVYDTEYVQAVKITIQHMENNETDYDSLPVAACKHCKSLHITIDEVENNHCMRCGSTNEIKIYKDIHTYLTAKELEDDAE